MLFIFMEKQKNKYLKAKLIIATTVTVIAISSSIYFILKMNPINNNYTTQNNLIKNWKIFNIINWFENTINKILKNN